jgi:hypothetical protein
MGIAMENACFEHHGEIGVHTNAAKYGDIILGALVEPFPINPFGGENFVRGALVNHGRGKYDGSQGCLGNTRDKAFGVGSFR